MCDAYGGDLMAMESVLSLLSFVEPLGEESRRWAHRRLNNVTEGYHGKMLVAFADQNSQFYTANWIKRAQLTVSFLLPFIVQIDPSVVEEFKAEMKKAESEKEAESAASEKLVS